MMPLGDPKTKSWELRLKMDNIIPLGRVVISNSSLVVRWCSWHIIRRDRYDNFDSFVWSEKVAEKVFRICNLVDVPTWFCAAPFWINVGCFFFFFFFCSFFRLSLQLCSTSDLEFHQNPPPQQNRRQGCNHGNKEGIDKWINKNSQFWFYFISFLGGLPRKNSDETSSSSVFSIAFSFFILVFMRNRHDWNLSSSIGSAGRRWDSHNS